MSNLISLDLRGNLIGEGGKQALAAIEHRTIVLYDWPPLY